MCCPVNEVGSFCAVPRDQRTRHRLSVSLQHDQRQRSSKGRPSIEKFLLDRWSPRAMSGEEISQEELMRLFEAARWAPSSFNTQQWRALYARRGTEHWQTFFDLLVDANKAWAKNAAVLVVFISRKNFDHNNEPSVTHSYDCGAAGRISRCKASNRVWSCMGCKDSITIGRAKNCGSRTNSKSKPWQPSAGQVRKNYFLKNCRRAKVRMIGGKFRKASLRDRSEPK